MALKFVDDDNQNSSEGLLGTLGRNATRTLLEGSSGIMGSGGNILDLLSSLGNYGIETLTGKENVIPGSFLPTSQQLREGGKKNLEKEYGPGYADPQNFLERILSGTARTGGEIVGSGLLLGPLFGAAKGAQLAKQAITGGLGAGATGEAGSALFGEESRPLFEAVGSIAPPIAKGLISVALPSQAEKYAANLFNKAKAAAPEKPFKANTFKTVIQEMERDLQKRDLSEGERKFLTERIAKLRESTNPYAPVIHKMEEQLKTGELNKVDKQILQRRISDLRKASTDEIDPRDLIDLKESWNNLYKKYAGTEHDYEKKWLGKLSHASREIMERNKDIAPEFVNDYLQANDMWKAINDRYSISSILSRSKIAKSAAAYPLYKLFAGGIGSALATAGKGLVAFPLVEGVNIARNIAKSPAMTKYYTEMVKAAAQNNEAKLLSVFKRANKEYEKEFPQKKKRFKFVD